MAESARHWLVKSEPSEFSFDDLWKAPRRTTAWDGVRNYQARNFMRDGMKQGDPVLFYHSSTSPQAVVGLCEVAREAYPDPTQFERGHPHHDAGSDPADPRWLMVDLRAKRRFPRPVTLAELRASARLAGLPLLQRGQRLSVMPIEPQHFAEILRLGDLGAG